MKVETLKVGDVIEIDGLFPMLSSEDVLVTVQFIQTSGGGRRRQIDCTVSYLGVFLGGAICYVDGDTVTWNWRK